MERSSLGRWVSGRHLLAGLLILTIAQTARGEITDRQVRDSIERAAAYLESQQRADGSWRDYTGFPGGTSALCTLALLNSGREVTNPKIQLALSFLRGMEAPSMIYTSALQTLVFCAAEPDKDAALIRRNADWIQSIQLKDGARKGGWGYAGARGDGDNSNSQYALLALHEAERVGVSVPDTVWQNAWDYWVRCQRDDGSWGYTERDSDGSTGSMTCAGIASLIICAGRISPGDAKVVNGAVQCCSEQTNTGNIERGLQWLGNKFSPVRNPSPGMMVSSHYYYYMYGVERVGRMSGNRFLGRHDWYREGAEVLVSQQDALRSLWVGSGIADSNPLVATSFALLFMSKGRRPVVLGKLKYGEGNEWDLHRSAVGNLTRRIERRWRRDLSWQTIDARAATVENLLEAPVLFISGRSGFNLPAEQKDNLRRYVDQGGFLFVESCCDGGDFDRDFRALAKELFPDSPLRLLPPDHPVWWAEEQADPKYIRPLYGIDACCRTSVVYCPQNLACYWELSPGTRPVDYPKPIQEEIEACLRIGENVVTYATNRELKNKLDRPQLTPDRDAGELATRGVLRVPKLRHSGGGDDAPNALPRLLSSVSSQGIMRVDIENRLIGADDPGLFEYPVLFMHGRRNFRFNAAERKALGTYLQRGGVLFADAICASPEFANSFRREIEAILPGKPLNRIPPNHPIFTRQFRGFDLRSVTLRDPQTRAKDDPLKANLVSITPLLEGIEIDGRFTVVFSPYDISCALESGTSLQCKGYVKEDAAKIGTNIILYALQQ